MMGTAPSLPRPPFASWRVRRRDEECCTPVARPTDEVAIAFVPLSTCGEVRVVDFVLFLRLLDWHLRFLRRSQYAGNQCGCHVPFTPIKSLAAMQVQLSWAATARSVRGEGLA